jgi:hypothetical protein
LTKWASAQVACLPVAAIPKISPLWGAADRHIAGHNVAFGDLLLDLELDVRKSFA